MTVESDPVTVGIREWQKTREGAAEAIARARRAEEDIAYYRGQCDLMTEQRRADVEHARKLQQQYDELKLEMQTVIGAFETTVRAISDKLKAGPFRRPGSVAVTPTNGNGRASDEGLDENLRELARSIVAKPKPPAPSKTQ
jgi:hypothetical protein